MYSKIQNGRLVIDRRDVIRGGLAAGAAAILTVPAGLAQSRGEGPTGQTETIELGDATSVDVSALNPGELAVIMMNGTFVGILRRNEEQQTAAAATDGALSGESDADRTVDAEYLVAELKCLHRGCYVAYTGDAETAFKCPCHRTTFDAAGRVISGKTSKSLPFVGHTIENGIVSFAEG